MNTETDKTWLLPEGYLDLTSHEQAEVLKTSILRFLRVNGPNTSATIAKEIHAKRNQSVRRTLDRLVATRRVYSESYGPKTTVYFPNGSLAHPLLQANLRCGPNREYVIRTYSDRFAGRYLTVTEYEVAYSGSKKPIGGIKLDMVDIEDMAHELQRILEASKSSEVVDRGMVTR